ncbi:hypothetical protein [Sorangium sp. So ce513]|uniref:hypothetical protein n=1 Tax=Sorangium sp. So ce513 TaxID=3133315 RepID=UPI003F5EBABA
MPTPVRTRLGKTWEERVAWVKQNPDELDAALYEVDVELHSKRRKHLVIFDALDQAADDWGDLRRLLKGLLQILLEFRSYRAIRAKAFVRPDLLSSPEVSNFPDASKVFAGEVRLSWPRAELFALLWQHLANADRGADAFRDGCARQFRQTFEEIDDVWSMPDDMRRDEDLQRAIFHAITGPYMGAGPKKGFPYTWLPNHLGDTQGQVSPRSFLSAMRAAATDDRYTSKYPLHHEALKQGVQDASRIRVREIVEDFPWVDIVMRPLRGLTLLCEFEEIESRWQEEGVLEELEAYSSGVPPRRLSEGHWGLCKDLEDLSVFEGMSDGRINMPDVYRIGFGLGRRGGIPPVR